MSKSYPQSKKSSLLSSSEKNCLYSIPAEYLFPLPSAILQLQGVGSYYYSLLCFYPIYWTVWGGDIYTYISSYNVTKLDLIVHSVVLVNISWACDRAIRTKHGYHYCIIMGPYVIKELNVRVELLADEKWVLQI